MDFKNIFLFKYLDVMCQRKKIGKIFGLIQKQLLVVKYLFWSIMLESIQNMDGRPASISCSLGLVMEPSLPLKRWEFQRSVSFPLNKYLLEVLRGQQIKLIYTVSNPKCHEYYWKDLTFLKTTGGREHNANVFPIKSAGNPCVAKCSL